MAVIAMMRGEPKDGYHCRCSNRHNQQIHGVTYVQYDHRIDPT